MPLLGGLFGKKNKSYARSVNGASLAVSPSDVDSALSSPTNSYVTTEKSLPSSPNSKNSLSPEAARISPSKVYPSIASGNPSSSSSKLRLPFSRKRSKPPVPDASNSSASTSYLSPPRPAYAARLSSSAASDTEASEVRRLGPPPSKSAIFAAYTDPSNALSTRSLPDEPTHSWSSMHIPPGSSTSPVPPKEKEKRPSLFSWSKSSSSAPAKPLASEQSRSSALNHLDSDASSFNLKSFRHVRPPSPTASTSSLVVPPPRPRGASVNSDTSQRISVAAFREAQARRSTAGSPVPSFRSPSPSLPPGFPQDGQRGRASPRPSQANQLHSSPHLRNGAHQRRRSANIAVGYTSESDESTATSEGEESDDEGGAGGGRNTRVQRDGTITPRTLPLIGQRQAKSEIGHGSSSNDSPMIGNSRAPLSFLTTRSQSGHGQPDDNVRQSSYVAKPQHSHVESPPPRPNSSMDLYNGGAARPRASASTSALSPPAAAKRASILVNANAGSNQDPLAEVKQATRHVRDSSTYSNPGPSQPRQKRDDIDASDSDSNSDSDSDNAPLASLVPPRRPGSALSSTSNTSLRTNGTRGPGGRTIPKPLIDINELTDKKPSVGTYKNGDEEAFTKGGLLANHLSGVQPSSNTLVESPTSIGLPSSPWSGSSSSKGLTSKAPTGGFAHFAPPTSPPKEMEAYASLDTWLANPPSRPQPQPVRKPDAEKEREKEKSPERRRDMLTDRLAKLAKGKGKDGIDGSASLGGAKRPASPPPAQSTPSVRPDSPPRRPAAKLSIPPSGVSSKPSPPDDELIHDVDDSILRLISQMDDSDVDVNAGLTPSPRKPPIGQQDDDDTSGSDSESDAYGEPEKKPASDKKSRVELPRVSNSEKEKDRIAPILIKQRLPQPSFSVMSRPPIQKPVEDYTRSTFTTAGSSTTAKLSLTAVANSPTLTSNFKSNSTLNSFASSMPSSTNSTTARKRSSTLIPSSTTTSVTTASSSSSSSTFGASTSSFAKLNSKGGSSVASPSNASSGGTSPRLSPANADRANALRTVASGGNGVGARSAAPVHAPQATRQRSSTMVPMMSSSSQPLNKISSPAPFTSIPPVKPFAVRRDSPASSTGDSSSGRVPVTPRDGSDIGSSRAAPSSGKKERKDEWSSGVSGLGVSGNRGGASAGAGRHVKRRSVSFDDSVDKEEQSVSGRKSRDHEDEADVEVRRKERRRGEAKAAIELGNVINGPGPVVSDDEDDLPIDQAMNTRMSAVNPMMTVGNPMQMQMQMSYNSAPGSPATRGANLPTWPQQNVPPQMLSPAQFMAPFPADPNFMAAHQQAMMFAKQAYQMAVARQAMAAAADEWDRNSAVGGSVYGGPTSNASVMMGSPSPFNMVNMGGMGNGWSTGSVTFPNTPQSAYGGISSSRSEYGGGSGGMRSGNWSSARSTYGESFGPSDRARAGNRNSGMMRDSGYYPPMPPIPQSYSGGSSSSGARGRGRMTSAPATPSRGAMRKAPPSSWKAGV
ncbi:hypothetical protein AN958_10923 [Leucoagaricus sp. SymC.cos]|nr:hypothetical protein AN958_10923 [Leucoagaricus sp. SymC.cos]